MSEFETLFTRLGLPTGDRYDLPASAARFPDGAHYRVEIPSTEGPRALRAVVEGEQLVPQLWRMLASADCGAVRGLVRCNRLLVQTVDPLP